MPGNLLTVKYVSVQVLSVSWRIIDAGSGLQKVHKPIQFFVGMGGCVGGGVQLLQGVTVRAVVILLILFSYKDECADLFVFVRVFSR